MGCKRLLFGILPFAITFWGLLSYSPTLGLMNVARIALGFIFGLASPLMSPFISEICESRVRGFAIVCMEAFCGLGALMGYIQAKYLSWRVATLLSAVPLLPALIILPFVPEVRKLVLCIF